MPNYAITLTKERSSVLKRTRKNKDSILGGERGGWKSPRQRERERDWCLQALFSWDNRT